MAGLAQQMVISGLTTVTNGIQATGTYNITASLTLPNQQEGASADSQVVCTVKQNGSTIYTSTAGSTGWQILSLPCTAGDSISVALTSAAAVDQGLNTVKCTVAIG